MVDKGSGVLGFYDLKSKNLVFYRDNVIKSTYKKPENVKDYEKNHLVLIWGEETPQELFFNILSIHFLKIKIHWFVQAMASWLNFWANVRHQFDQ